jgi:hypothetical protein
MCRDNRAYAFVPFTIPGPVEVLDYGPMWRADRDYWIARLVANVGRHDTDSHPNDGTPGGGYIRVNMRRVSRDYSSDISILTADNRLAILEDHHQDVVNDEDTHDFNRADFNIHRLKFGEHIYPSVTAIGSSRPGTGLVVTIVLVPIP